VKPDPRRTCEICGVVIPADGVPCPVCALRGALDVGHETVELNVDSTPSLAGSRFDHYEILIREDGTPLELGRGAMGVTYKAVDINLRCAVALKVINARFIGDDSARRRFVREARAAASVRHPNVASVFHLGKSDDGYFYAMEYVEGETLDSLIKRCGRLELKQALEVMSEVAAGLAAIHEQSLVHRDIKPTNIMVNLKDGGQVTAKIIDLGLAKTVADTPTDAAISIPGAFAGTPVFASPEQFAGFNVDIRSDLYSLGVVLWEMATGHVLFRGSPAELMFQHQHASLPLGRLQDVRQPVAVLLEKLLDKDPAQRFQTPNELLKAMPTVMGALEVRNRITRESLQKTPSTVSRTRIRKAQATPGPKKISIARLPVTGSELFGREEDIAFLDDAWASKDANVATIVAWAGVGKSTLVNHWLRQMAAEQYRSAQVVFGWSFYRQGTSGGTSSADEFIDATLAWFGDPDPRIGTAWEKGERLAKLISNRRALLVLDGLEPLQNPPGPQEGRLRDPSLQSLLRELAAFNKGLCVITTRTPIADIADYQPSSAPRCSLEHLSGDAGAKLLRALGVHGNEVELRSASNEFSGHCLALTLLGSYLTDAYHGDIRRREEVSTHLAHDPRQGVHARKVMESYQTWFGEGPELAILRMLGLFDRPTDEQTVNVLLKSPAIAGLTESLTDLQPTEWQTVLAKLRRARLLAGEDPHNPGQLDAHPLVREYFGEQLRKQKANAWRECNRRLFNHYQTLAPQLPDSLREMEPLFSAVICGCNAGLFQEALHKVYIARIQRGDAWFAANALGAIEPLLSVLIHFFEQGRWGSLVETAAEGQSLSADDQLLILTQAAQCLIATRGYAAPEARICYERAELLCHSLENPRLLCMALIGRWRYSLMTEKLTAAMQTARRVYSLAQEQNDPALMIEAYNSLAITFFYSGDFGCARECTIDGIEVWRSGGARSYAVELHSSVVTCLCYKAASDWHVGEITSAKATIAEAISLAKELKDMQALAHALHFAEVLAYCERKSADVERLSSDLIELSTRHNFFLWLALATSHRGWVRGAGGNAAEGILCVEQGIRDLRTTGIRLSLPYYLALKAEVLHLAGRTPEAFEAIKEAEALAEKFEEHWWSEELHRLRGVFLAAMGADETEIETSFCEAISTAKEQKSVSLEKRAEATYAEYRRQKASGSGGRGFRLPLC